MDRETLRDRIPAYALGALDADERREVEAWLEEDESARQLLDDYAFVVESLALTAPAVPPPPDLETKLRQKLRQQSIVMIDWRPFAALAAVFLAFLTGMLLLARTPDAPSAKALYDRLMTDPNVMQVALEPDDDAPIEGVLIFRDEDPLAVIRVANLPELDSDQIYQVWMVDRDGSTSGGTHQLSTGVNYIEVPITKPVAEYVRFGMSVEPAPGSPFGNRPSGPRVFNIPIESQ